MGESSRDALLRELKEELNVDAEIGELIWVIENIFTYNGNVSHKIELIYKVRCKNIKTEETFSVVDESDNNKRLQFKWFKIEAISNLKIYPKCMSEQIQNIPINTTYILNDER